MKATIAALFVLALLFVTGCSNTVAQPVVTHTPSSVKLAEPPKDSPVPVVAPEVTLPSVRVHVATTPAPAVPQTAPVVQHVEPLAVPVVPVVPSKVEPVRCEEDMPCWDCKTMGNRICGPVSLQAPPVKVDPYSGNPIVDCKALGLLTAEDYSCVPASFYASAPVKPTAPAYRPDLEDSMQPVKPPVTGPVTAPKPPVTAPVVVPPAQPSAPVTEPTTDCDKSSKDLQKALKKFIKKNIREGLAQAGNSVG